MYFYATFHPNYALIIDRVKRNRQYDTHAHENTSNRKRVHRK